jgi:hypothetical protein
MKQKEEIRAYKIQPKPEVYITERNRKEVMCASRS